MLKTKRVGIILAVSMAVLLIVFFAAMSLVDADSYRGRIEAVLTSSLGRPVQFGRLEVSIWSGSLVATAPSIADDPAFSNQPFLTAKDVRIGVELWPLLAHRELHITGFTIDQPVIALLRAANGTWNYSSLGGEGKRQAPTPETNTLLPNLTVGSIDIKGGALTIDTFPSSGAPRTYSGLNLSAQNFSFANAFPFTVSATLAGGGSLDVNGSAGPINQRDASLTPLTAQISLKQADLVKAGFVDPDAGISGIADLDAKLVSNGQTAQADGTLQLAELSLAKNGKPSAQPIDLQFSVNQDLQALSGKLASATLKLGAAALTATGTYQTLGATTTMQMHINGQSMPIDSLEAFLPSLGIQLPSGSRLQGGTLTVALDLSGTAAVPVVSGPVRIENTQLAGFDLGQKLAGIEALTGAKTGSATTIETLSANLHYGPDGTRTDNLTAVVTGLGSASGSGSISPDGALNYHLSVTLASGIGAIANKALGLLSGKLGASGSRSANAGIPITIAGTTSNPTFAPDMKQFAAGAIPTKKQAATALGKALGGFLPH